MHTSKVPKSVLYELRRMEHKVSSYHMEDDDYGSEDGKGPHSIWIYLRPGWVSRRTETGTIHEATVKEAAEELRAAHYAPEVYRVTTGPMPWEEDE